MGLVVSRCGQAKAGKRFPGYLAIAATALALTGCSEKAAEAPDTEQTASVQPVFEPVDTFVEPWAMTFLPDGKHALVTERKGKLLLWAPDKSRIEVAGVPKVDYDPKWGLGDVVLHPKFKENGLVYLSWAEPGPNKTRGAAVGRAKLVIAGNTARLEGLEVIWRQDRKVANRGHFGHRLVFAPDGTLFITSGDRQTMTPAQDLTSNLGKIVRINDDGSLPADNPFADKGGIAAQVWSYGHRNPLGLAFDADGKLWENENGPTGGDELNLIEKGKNYGWPLVSNGDQPDGTVLPRHSTRPDLAAPKFSWNPSIAPSCLIIYSGKMFPEWAGNAFMGALAGQKILRLSLVGGNPRVLQEWPMEERVREIEQAPDGGLWVMEDAPGGRLLQLRPGK